MWLLRYASGQTDRQTNTHADRNASTPTAGEVKTPYIWLSNKKNSKWRPPPCWILMLHERRKTMSLRWLKYLYALLTYTIFLYPKWRPPPSWSLKNGVFKHWRRFRMVILIWMQNWLLTKVQDSGFRHVEFYRKAVTCIRNSVQWCHASVYKRNLIRVFLIVPEMVGLYWCLS